MSFSFSLNPAIPQNVADALAVVAAFVDGKASTKPAEAINAVATLGEIEAAINRLA